MHRRIALVMALDDAYATPLAVTVTSALDHLRADVGLDLYVMSEGLPLATRHRLERTWDARVRLHWVAVETGALPHGAAAARAANHRLLVGSHLPPDLDKVVYLDADTLVCRDLVELWDRNMDGHVVLAVQDAYVQAMPPRCLASTGTTAGHARPYFNSGVLVIDLAAWRAAGIEDVCLTAVARLRRRTRWLDQDALNASLAGRWGALPPAWNKQFWLDVVPDWRCSPYGREEFEAARRAPAIIHFCTETKPWQRCNDHRPEDVVAYRAVLRRVASEDAAATDVPSAWGERMGARLAAGHRRVRDTLAAMLRAKRRRIAVAAMLPRLVRLTARHPWTLVTVPLAVLGQQLRLRVGGPAGGRSREPRARVTW